MTLSKLYLCILAILALFMIVACGSASSSTGGGSSQANITSIPFTTFIQNVNTARYSDYASLPSTKVQNEQAFEDMRTHILKLYSGVQADSSYMSDGQYIDCILSTANASNPPGPTTIGTATSGNAGGVGVSTTSSSCKAGTVPMQRLTLEKLVTYPTLQAFLAKSPGGGSLPPTPKTK